MWSRKFTKKLKRRKKQTKKKHFFLNNKTVSKVVELCALIMNVAYYSVHKILIAVCEYFFLFVPCVHYLLYFSSFFCFAFCLVVSKYFYFLHRIRWNLAHVVDIRVRQNMRPQSNTACNRCSFSSTFNWKVSILSCGKIGFARTKLLQSVYSSVVFCSIVANACTDTFRF